MNMYVLQRRVGGRIIVGPYPTLWDIANSQKSTRPVETIYISCQQIPPPRFSLSLQSKQQREEEGHRQQIKGFETFFLSLSFCCCCCTSLPSLSLPQCMQTFSQYLNWQYWCT